jgi:hypothetical protein
MWPMRFHGRGASEVRGRLRYQDGGVGPAFSAGQAGLDPGGMVCRRRFRGCCDEVARDVDTKLDTAGEVEHNDILQIGILGQ